MATKVIRLGETKPKRELKKIEFHKLLTNDTTFEKQHADPSIYKNIEIICE